MNKSILVVIKKELKDIIRDKRTLLVSILLPMIMYPLLFTIMGNTISDATKDAETDTTVALMGDAVKADVYQYFTAVFSDEPGVKFIDTDDPIEALSNGEVKIIINIPPGTEYSVSDKGIPFELIYDEDKMSSTNSLSFLQHIINEYNETALEKELSAMGISLDDLYPLKPKTTSIVEIRTGESKPAGNMFLSMIVPMLMAIFLAMSGMSAAIDIFAGEKERRTLEPLLATKAPRSAILAGKYLAVAISGIITTTAMMGGMAIGYMLNPTMLSMDMGDISVSLSIPSLLLAIVLILIMTMVFTGIHVAMSAFSKNIKEASTYSSFVMLAGMIPGYMTMYLQAGDIKLWMMAVPVYNVLGAMKIVLSGNARYDYLAVAILCSFAFLAVILIFIQNLFKRESIMFRM